MTKLQFPETFEAAMRGENAQWAIGDALLKEVGKPPASSANDGSHAKIQAVAKELFENGVQIYSVKALAGMRQTAFDFGPNCRIPGIAFHAHRAAGDPDSLAVIIETVPEGRVITQPYVEQVRAHQRTLDTAARDKKRARLIEEGKTEEASKLPPPRRRKGGKMARTGRPKKKDMPHGLAKDWRGRVWLNPPYQQPHIVTAVRRPAAGRGPSQKLRAPIFRGDYGGRRVWGVPAAEGGAILPPGGGRAG
jgi:hypothetical protein